MKLPKTVRARLAKELEFVAQRMKVEGDPFTKLYFFSAGYGEVGRILNNTWDAELALFHLVLQATYTGSYARLQAMAGGRDRAVGLPEDFFEELTNATSDLADIVLHERDGELYLVLSRLAESAYLTTGNGYYLYLKGAIRPRQQ